MALASRLAQLQAKACEATRFVARHGCEYQRSLVEKNKKYVVEPPTIEKCQELSKQLLYTRLARFVQSISSLPNPRILWQIVCAVLRDLNAILLLPMYLTNTCRYWPYLYCCAGL